MFSRRVLLAAYETVPLMMRTVAGKAEDHFSTRKQYWWSLLGSFAECIFTLGLFSLSPSRVLFHLRERG